MVCRNDWSIRRDRLEIKYTHEMGTVKIAAPNDAKSKRNGLVGASKVRSTLVYTGSNVSVFEEARSLTPPSGK